MTSFRRIVQPAYDRPSLPQCSSPVEWLPEHEPARSRCLEGRSAKRYLKEHHDLDPAHCSRGGSIEIDGKPYCATHAGGIALRILLGESE